MRFCERRLTGVHAESKTVYAEAYRTVQDFGDNAMWKSEFEAQVAGSAAPGVTTPEFVTVWPNGDLSRPIEINPQVRAEEGISVMFSQMK